jgi:glc operon protein GlcG
MKTERLTLLATPEFKAFLDPSAAAASGGAPIMVEGVCAGAFGVPGAKGEEDHEIAKAGPATLSSSA